MVDGLSIFALLVAFVALLVALTAYDKASAQERQEKPANRTKEERATTLTAADRRRMAVEMRQHQNFMTYDGKPQSPIDESRILGEE